MATLAELRTRVLAMLDREGISVTSTGYGQVTNWINDAIREVFCARHNWPSMERAYIRSTTAGSADMSYPDTLTKDVAMLLIRETATSDWVPLDEMTDQQARYEYRDSATQGLPNCWFRFGESIRLRPVPDSSTYRLRLVCWSYPADLVNDGDENSFTIRYPRCLSLWATVYGLEFYGEVDTSLKLQQVAEAEIASLIREDQNRSRARNAVVTPSRASGIPAGPRRMGSRRSLRRMNLGI
jgi:hypothetical protein